LKNAWLNCKVSLNDPVSVASDVGMEDAKSSLIYHAIDPRIGGTSSLAIGAAQKALWVRAFAECCALPATRCPLC